jgi:hypothetical protein
MEINEPKTDYATDKQRTFEPRPRKIDAKKFGQWIVERDRKVLAMLEEYDRRQEKRRSKDR